VRTVALHGHVAIGFATIIFLYCFIFIKFGVIAITVFSVICDIL